MSSINLQFHATKDEMIELIKKTLVEFELYMVAIKLSPKFHGELISIDEFEDKLNIINECDMVFFSISRPNEIPNKYIKFLDNNKNSLVFHIGEKKNNILVESDIGTITQDIEILKLWKKIINKYKKTLLKGAWVINTKIGRKDFDKNHYYTAKAQKAFQDGLQMVQFLESGIFFNLSNDL
ncbi:MAG: hypothetical protein PHD15_05725 [Clostridia bacterium]|nr:hypothetical protein [Clostridia bacterium]MDD4387231.1 hypothetical protein [Clostridia bacterium]